MGRKTELKIKRISIFKEFQCIGAKCPVSCCKGWKIPVDDAVYQKYLSEKGSLGKRLRYSVMKKEDLITFRSGHGKCPFWKRDRLCYLQKKYGTEYMPQICVRFPRQLSNLGPFCEETLYLACPEAARLFLARVKQGEHFLFEETEGTVAYGATTTNDDEDFLAYLLAAREQLVEMLGGGCRFDSISLLHYGRDAQNACLSGEEPPSPLKYKDTDAQRLAVDCDILNRLLFNGFYHFRLRMRSPLLYRLCRKYIKELGMLSKINRNAANRKLAFLKADLYRKLPELDMLLERYYEYYLQTDFLDIYEDYSFAKHLLFGMVKADVLWVFLALFAKNRENITEEQIANIIAVFERRAYRMEGGLKSVSFP